MPRTLVIGTKNAKKLAEMQALLETGGVEVVSVAETCPEAESPEETGTTFDANARLKALYFARKAGMICVADDSGLEVDALDGAPGVWSSRYAGEDGNDRMNNLKLLEELDGVPESSRGAQFRCVIAVASPDRVYLTTEAEVRGVILEAPRGEGGFGYDPLFHYPEWDKTFAEVPPEKKAEVSHRGQALAKLSTQLAGVLTIIDNQRNF